MPRILGCFRRKNLQFSVGVRSHPLRTLRSRHWEQQRRYSRRNIPTLNLQKDLPKVICSKPQLQTSPGFQSWMPSSKWLKDAARRCHPVLLSPSAVVKFHDPTAKSSGCLMARMAQTMSAIAENFTESSKRCIACSTCHHKRNQNLPLNLPVPVAGAFDTLERSPWARTCSRSEWYLACHSEKRCLEICPLPTLQNGCQWCCLLSAGSSWGHKKQQYWKSNTKKWVPEFITTAPEWWESLSLRSRDRINQLR